VNVKPIPPQNTTVSQPTKPELRRAPPAAKQFICNTVTPYYMQRWSKNEQHEYHQDTAISLQRHTTIMFEYTLNTIKWENIRYL